MKGNIKVEVIIVSDLQPVKLKLESYLPEES